MGQSMPVNVLRVLYVISARLFDNPKEVYSKREEVLKLAEALGLSELRDFFQEADDGSIEAHRVEMFELAPRCPPYGGYYALGEDSRERGLYMHQILTYYKALGFTMDVRRELPDYLPVMLEFLAATSEAEGASAQVRRDFYRRFIKPWFPKFKKCVEESKSPYRHIVNLLQRLFDEEFEAGE